MKPLRLTARGYRSFADLDYAFVDGATAVVGSNGAGKSSLIGAVEIALFGPRSRSLEPLVREGQNEMQLTLEFEHGDDVYRVRRSWKSGKSALDFEQVMTNLDGGENGHRPLTQGSAADTQTLLESIVGMSRRTFTASGYLAQRDSATFTGAQPRDRKQILSDALALDAWQTNCDRVTADRRQTEKSIAAADTRVEQLAERAAAADPLTAEAGDLRLAVDVEQAGVTEHTSAAEEHAQRAHDLDQADTASKIANANAAAARTADTAHREKLAAAQVAREKLDGQRQELGRLERLDSERSELAAKHAALAEQAAARTEALRARQALVDDIARYTADLAERAAVTARQEAERVRLTAARTALEAGTVNHCDRCQQTLPDDARAAAIESLAKEIEAHTLAQARHLDDTSHVDQLRAGAVAAEAAASVVIPAEPDGLRDASNRLLELINVPVDLATVRERIAGLEQTIAAADTDDYRDEARRLSFELAEAERLLAEIPPLVPGAADNARAAALQAKAQAEAHAVRARAASERLAAVTALLEQAQTAAVDHAAARDERDLLHAELDVLARLEQAFGRDGIPAWIVESQALPQIETEANRILTRLGGAISRVELRTERETKTGKVNEALDIVCFTDDGERALETFSGGEQSRAEIALALGLVDVLQSRRDADLRYLALDEPSGLDGQGTAALAELLQERAAGTVVMVASHDPNLRDQFDQAIVVERGPTGSEVIA